MAKSLTITNSNRFTLCFYFQTMTRMLSSPEIFFEEFSDDAGFQKPFWFLLVSSLFFTGASLTQIHENLIQMTGILFLNAVIMPFITAFISFIAMTMSMGKEIKFIKLFAVFSYASGVTLLASWIPLFIWLTEPWKWALIYIGMRKGCGLRSAKAFLIIGITISVMILFFWSLGPVISYLKGIV